MFCWSASCDTSAKASLSCVLALSSKRDLLGEPGSLGLYHSGHSVSVLAGLEQHIADRRKLASDGSHLLLALFEACVKPRRPSPE